MVYEKRVRPEEITWINEAKDRIWQFRLGLVAVVASLVLIGGHALKNQWEKSANDVLAKEQKKRAEESESLNKKLNRQATTVLSDQYSIMSILTPRNKPQRKLLLAMEAVDVSCNGGYPVEVAAENALRNSLAMCGGTPPSAHNRLPDAASGVCQSWRMMSGSECPLRASLPRQVAGAEERLHYAGVDGVDLTVAVEVVVADVLLVG